MVKSDLKFRTNRRLYYQDADNNWDRLAYWSGKWQAGTYHPNEVVGHEGGLYICKIQTTLEPTTGIPEWDLMAFTSSSAVLYGQPANFAPGSSFTAVQNWPDSEEYGPFATPDESTGIITLPKNGIYRVTQQFVFQQGNSNKELACLLWLRSSIGGDYVVDSIQISDDKTDWRAVSSGFTINGTAGETLQSGLSWVNQTLGTVSFQPCTFEVELVLA